MIAIPYLLGLAALAFATYDERHSPWLALVVVVWVAVVVVWLYAGGRLEVTWHRHVPGPRKAPKRR